MADNSKLKTTIGLASKAGKAICGTQLIIEALRSAGKKKPCLVLEAADTSEGTHKKLSDKCSFYGVKHIRVELDMSELSGSVGKLSSVSAVGICDEGLARAVLSKIEAPHENS